MTAINVVTQPTSIFDERQLRRALTNKGHRLNKAPARHWTRKENGAGYQILRDNVVVAGASQREYELSLGDVYAFIVSPACDRVAA